MESRFLMVREGCHKCRDAVRVISKFNLRLPVHKRIRIIDCWEFEAFGLNNIPLIKTFDKMGLEEGYPFLFIDGAIIDPAPTPEQLRKFLQTFLKNDILY